MSREGTLRIEPVRLNRAWRPGEMRLAARACAAAFAAAPPRRQGPRRRRARLVLAFSGSRFVRRLNRDFRGRDAPANVLAFPPGETGPAPEEAALLGEVVLARGRLCAEARAAGLCFGDHLAHLAAHGTLHLLGYDHQVPAARAAMERLETRILSGLKRRAPPPL